MDLSNLPRATSDACRRPALRALAKLKVGSVPPRPYSSAAGAASGSTVCRGAWHWRPDAQIIPDVLRRYLISSSLVSEPWRLSHQVNRKDLKRSLSLQRVATI